MTSEDQNKRHAYCEKDFCKLGDALCPVIWKNAHLVGVDMASGPDRGIEQKLTRDQGRADASPGDESIQCKLDPQPTPPATERREWQNFCVHNCDQYGACENCGKHIEEINKEPRQWQINGGEFIEHKGNSYHKVVGSFLSVEEVVLVREVGAGLVTQEEYDKAMLKKTEWFLAESDALRAIIAKSVPIEDVQKFIEALEKCDLNEMHFLIDQFREKHPGLEGK